MRKVKKRKLEFTDPTDDVTFLFEQESNQRNRPGRGITGKCRNSRALATGKRPIWIRCAEHHLAPGPPLPPRKPPSTENVPIFSGLYGANLQVCNMKAFKNRDIFECWMAMRRGIPKGAHLCVAPLRSASFGTFLAETRKVPRVCLIDKLQFDGFTNNLLKLPHFPLAIFPVFGYDMLALRD